MEIDIIELSERSAKFILSDVDTSVANGIRRAMIADVPNLAIEWLELYDNTSVLYDEQLGLRLALVPLTMHPDYVPESECTCNGEGCPSCTLNLRLDAKGPKTVYSGDIFSSDPNVRPADDNIPIVELKEGQNIMLGAIAHVGYGRDHVRWQAGVACGYKNMPDVIIENCDGCGHCIDECPRHIIEIKNDEAYISPENMIKCSLCRLCERACSLKPPAIQVSYDPRSFVFTYESDGSYSAKDLVLKAADVIENRAAKMAEILDKI